MPRNPSRSCRFPAFAVLSIALLTAACSPSGPECVPVATHAPVGGSDTGFTDLETPNGLPMCPVNPPHRTSVGEVVVMSLAVVFFGCLGASPTF